MSPWNARSRATICCQRTGRKKRASKRKGRSLFGGPILQRELRVAPRRGRLFITRAVFASVLLLLIWTAWQALIGFDVSVFPSDLGAFSWFVFPVLASVQFLLVVFAAALTGVSCVSVEKDRGTFLLLLVTRLSDTEIVVDKFLIAAVQSVVLLLAGLPVFGLLTLWGGLGWCEIFSLFSLTLCSSFLAAAIGVVMGTWRERLFQAIALTLLSLVSASIGLELANTALGTTSPLDGATLFSSVLLIMRGPLPHESLLHFWLRTSGFSAVCLFHTVVVLTLAVIRLRRWNPRGAFAAEQRKRTQGAAQSELEPARPHGEVRRATRTVWNNPILWREVATRAYGHSPLLVKVGYFLLVALLSIGVIWGWSGASTPAAAMQWYASGLVPLAIISLLLINLLAITAITSELDQRRLELLLVTDIEPQEFLVGKMAGILLNTREMVAVPLVVLLAGWWWGSLSLRSALLAGVDFLVLAGFAAVLGIHAAFRHPTTRRSLTHGLGTMFLLFVGILICVYLIVISGRFEAQWASFLLFILAGSIGLWVSLTANAPSPALALVAAVAPMATFYCILALLVGDRIGPFLVCAGVYGFAIMAMLIPLFHDFDVAVGRTAADEPG